MLNYDIAYSYGITFLFMRDKAQGYGFKDNNDCVFATGKIVKEIRMIKRRIAVLDV